ADKHLLVRARVVTRRAEDRRSRCSSESEHDVAGEAERDEDGESDARMLHGDLRARRRCGSIPLSVTSRWVPRRQFHRMARPEPMAAGRARVRPPSAPAGKSRRWLATPATPRTGGAPVTSRTAPHTGPPGRPPSPERTRAGCPRIP